LEQDTLWSFNDGTVYKSYSVKLYHRLTVVVLETQRPYLNLDNRTFDEYDLF